MSDDYIKNKIITVEQLTELAIITADNAYNEVWDQVEMSEEAAYKMMAAHVIDMIEKESSADKEFVLMAVVTKLLVENFLLNVAIRTDNG